MNPTAESDNAPRHPNGADNMHTTSSVSQDDSDSEWEYEYDENETEDVYITIDLTSHVPHAHRPHVTTVSHDKTNEKEKTTDQNPPTTPAPRTTQPPPNDPIHLLNFHTDNPILSLQGKHFTCAWEAPIGTDLLFRAVNPKDNRRAPNPASNSANGDKDAVGAQPQLEPEPLYAAANFALQATAPLRLVAKPAKMVRKEGHSKAETSSEMSTQPSGPDAESAGAEGGLNASTTPPAEMSPSAETPARGPAQRLAAEWPTAWKPAQAHFLSLLADVKRAKGEEDVVPRHTRRIGKRRANPVEAEAEAVTAAEEENEDGSENEGEGEDHDGAEGPANENRAEGDGYDDEDSEDEDEDEADQDADEGYEGYDDDDSEDEDEDITPTPSSLAYPDPYPYVQAPAQAQLQAQTQGRGRGFPDLAPASGPFNIPAFASAQLAAAQSASADPASTRGTRGTRGMRAMRGSKGSSRAKKKNNHGGSRQAGPGKRMGRPSYKRGVSKLQMLTDGGGERGRGRMGTRRSRGGGGGAGEEIAGDEDGDGDAMEVDSTPTPQSWGGLGGDDDHDGGVGDGVVE